MSKQKAKKPPPYFYDGPPEQFGKRRKGKQKTSTIREKEKPCWKKTTLPLPKKAS